MAITLSDAASNDIAWVLEYLTNSNGLEKPQLDDKSIEVLARHYVELGYTSQLQFLEDFRDRPLWMLLNIFAVLATADGEALTAESLAQLQIAANSIKDQREPGEATYQALLNSARADGAESELWLLENLDNRPLATTLAIIIDYFGNADSEARVRRISLLP